MELILIVILTMFNGILAMSEAAVISSRKARLQQFAEEKRPGAQAALELVQAPNHFLSTVQIGITLIGILAGAFGGATVARDFADVIDNVAGLAPYADQLGFGLVVLFTTYLSLIIGELIPKRLAIQNPEGIASRIAPPMRLLSTVTYPLVWFLSLSTDAGLRLFGVRAEGEPDVTEEEITVMLREGARAGVFQWHETEMVQGVFRLDDLSAASLMTPRTEVVWLDAEAPMEDNRRAIMSSAYSRYPVFSGNQDNVIGVVQVKDMLRAVWADEATEIRTLAHMPMFLPESLPASSILERLRGRKQAFAFVVSEHGGIEGIITVNDVIEAVVGDIDEPEAVKRADGSWLIDGLMPIEEFKGLFELREVPDETTYNTLAGLMIALLGDVPSVSDQVSWQNFTFEVMDMDGRRVDKILVQRGAAPATQTDPPDTKTSS